MKTKFLLVITISAASYFIGYSQAESGADFIKVNISSTYVFGALKNLEFAPISRYNYDGKDYSLNYERLYPNRNLFELKLRYFDSQLESKLIPQLNSGYTKFSLEFLILKNIYDKPSFYFQIGLQSQSTVSIYEEGINYYLADQEFNIATQFVYQLSDKQFLSSRISVPLLLLRLSADIDFSTYSLNRYQGILWDLAYAYSISNHFELQLQYGFRYQRLQIPNAFRELQHKVGLGFNYKF